MGGYILSRLLLMSPTLNGSMAIEFGVVQFAPGGPVAQGIRTDRSGQQHHRTHFRRQ